ncbi:RagB/SusD family nutrient uptake outer membrane protein [Niabella drilacis]|uniref:RagB/SusD family nutrient uptake outer membrane protein n=1 Tax=Niabella drilacis (strain DSM 25811 / CCM 8410 / CCUG 62505 / LMG 26954 / E90) TaxID=1285928 RepID=UPI0015A1CA2B|nr:RagB/SusD family nutrient uptake outer membrane protein [Niabella drilacis]
MNEVVPSDGSLDPTVIFGSKEGVNNALVGIYGELRDYASGGQQNMYGIKSWQFNFEVRGNDLFSDPGNWWLYETNWSDNGYGRVATGGRTSVTWNMLYKTINNANAIILNTPNLQDGDAVKAPLIAEAKALRAYAYFCLARTYQFSYATNPDAPGVPIYTTPADAAVSGNPRAPLKEVYALIVSDLEEAVQNLPTTRIAKFRINKNVAAGLLAEVYQEMAMSDQTLWAKALANAETAMNGYPLMSAASYNDGFNTASNSEWIWGLMFNGTQSKSYAGWFGYIEPTNTPNTNFSARYNDIYVNSSFVANFTETDMRYKFLAAPGQSASLPWKRWVTIKFRDNATKSGDYVMMRAAEMHLIKAEAQAQMNNIPDAKTTLYALQLQRDPSAIKSAYTAKADVISEILLERRKELYGEEGWNYFDLKRYQLPLVRDGIHWSMLNIPANSNKWRWQFPQAEIDANKSLTSADQNPL